MSSKYSSLNSTPEISIIIRCFNEDKHIRTLLNRIFEQTVRNIEIIIVDSGSTDNTLAVASLYPAKILTILPEEFTFGFSLNQGCQLASGDFLVFASAHVIPAQNDWLEQLIKPFEDPKVAKVYGRQVGDNNTKFSEHQVFAKQFPPQSNWEQQLPFCNNANACVRRSLWLQHSYDETLTGLEDLEWGKWAVSKGYHLAYNANATIIHIHDESPLKILNRYRREAIALKKIFSDCRLTLFGFAFLWLSNVCLDLLRAINQGVFFKQATSILMFRSMQYWGTYQGINARYPVTQEMLMRFYYPRKITQFTKEKYTA